ncbi:hypothetical protein PV10_06297 [Exophiala mesophila]|uniref:VOC domain-containing protein n=1 Tax=Exophiala mesophila TaxID=212818 RepID=A0A0D1ZCW7_EXOME|nr:uncharacterized protein PV10_06297 [Exophiala mesophila]KIV91794.1 hypothetical protein PV10_06297 [Exophiala mesophila]
MPASITLTVSHLPTSTSFFLSALQPLGYSFRARQDQTIGFGPERHPTAPADFWITQEIPGVPAGAAHVAFPASSRSNVQDFFLAALKAGGKIHGEPAQRDALGYYSAAVIDFDGNSIEAVYRPALVDKSDGKSTVSRASATPSHKAPTTVSRAKTVVSVKSPTVVSQAKTVASVKAPTVVSQARTAVASQVKSVAPGSCVSAAAAPAPAPSVAAAPAMTAPATPAQPAVLDSLISEARNAATLALDLVNTVRPGLASANSAPAATGVLSSINADHAAGGAIVGTLIGVAAGAALQYAFSNRSKENNAPDPPPNANPIQPAPMDRSFTSPDILRPEYSSAVCASAVHFPVVTTYQAIEPAPTTYTYAVQSQYDAPRLITMQDNDPPAPPSDIASTIKAPASTHISRKKSVDSGFGPGPRDLEIVSTVSSKASRQSKKSTTKAIEPPPTSYRAPTVLTTADTQISKRSSSRSSGIKLRSESISRVLSSVTGRNKDEAGDHGKSTTSRARSQSRHSERSRRSRKDEWDDGEEEAKTVLHVTVRTTDSSHVRSSSKAGSRAMSRSSSKHSHHHHSNHSGHSSHVVARGSGESNVSREPNMYTLPPSRAATWAGGAGSESGSFVSALQHQQYNQHQHGHSGGIGQVAAPRTIIGRLTSRNLSKQGRGTAYRDFAEVGTESVLSKKKEMEGLGVTAREVRPEDSISQVSVNSSRGRSMRSGSRRR